MIVGIPGQAASRVDDLEWLVMRFEIDELDIRICGLVKILGPLRIIERGGDFGDPTVGAHLALHVGEGKRAGLNVVFGALAGIMKDDGLAIHSYRVRQGRCATASACGWPRRRDRRSTVLPPSLPSRYRDRNRLRRSDGFHQR